MELLSNIFHGVIHKFTVFFSTFEFTFFNTVIPLTVLFFLFFHRYVVKNWVIEGIDFHPFSDSSAPNAAFQLKGNKWTNNSTLRYKFAETKKSSLKIDNFDFVTEYGKKKISWLKKMFMTKAEIYIEPVKLCESVTMIAPMGGGKTVTLTNFVLPPWYNRALINDEKSGDFVSKWYNKRKDIILCPFDSRAHVWDVLSEDIEILEFYIQNTINAVTGGKDNQSFFTNDAKERYQTLARLTLEIESPKEKWNYFIKELEKMFDDVNNGASKSAMDVVGNMQQIVNILKINQFQLACGKKSFTINDFFTKKNQSKIFMLNIDKYTLSLNILFSAFTACFAMIHASQAESKEDLTFYLLDEYLSLKMTYEAKVILHTKIRSKGGALLCAMHYLPDEKKLFNLLTSSTYAYMIFSVKNPDTRKFFEGQIGKREYLIKKYVEGKYQESKAESEILDWSENDKLSKDKKHITYIPEEGALFVGRSDYVDKSPINEPFVLDENVRSFYLKLNAEYLSKQEKSALTSAASKKIAAKTA